MSSYHFHVMWSSRTLPVLVPMFKNLGDWDHLVLSNYLGVTLFTFFREASAMVQERRLGTLVEPLVHAEVIWNPAWSGHTGPALYSCTDTGGVMGVFFFFTMSLWGVLKWTVDLLDEILTAPLWHGGNQRYSSIKEAKKIIYIQIDWSLICLGLSSLSDPLFLSPF